MKEIILNFPKQFKEGLEIGKALGFKKQKIKKILICGMGGSALPGDLLVLFSRNLGLGEDKIFIHRDYGLPKFVNKDFLVFTISYSGNTEETISAFKQAKKRKLKIVAISSGGELEKLAKRSKIPFAKIPFGFPPRMALGYLFSSIAKILIDIGFLPNFEREILDLEKKLLPEKLKEKGKKLAKFLFGFCPLIYSSLFYKELARIWKIKINENSKMPAFSNYFPELNHNEMTGIGEADKKFRKFFKVLILRDKKDFPRNQKRMEILSQIFKEKEIENTFVDLEGKTIFEKVFSNIILADWVSFYLAKFQKIDPIPVKLVEEFKKRMKK
ncbi:bifunctional phosphoglucose/phosphomannose isomerase [Candidatus Parcubacteria bacterium]|nr:bifunctional phosphoglucose/phosphomannose isomerase [Candidatus Parcubacteria bacterium]